MNMICDGNCEEHVGKVKIVHVTKGIENWGYFCYCQKAIEYDRGNGFTVEVVERGKRIMNWPKLQYRNDLVGLAESKCTGANIHSFGSAKFCYSYHLRKYNENPNIIRYMWAKFYEARIIVASQNGNIPETYLKPFLIRNPTDNRFNTILPKPTSWFSLDEAMKEFYYLVKGKK